MPDQSAILDGVPPGGIVLVGDRWGVVCETPSEWRERHRSRSVDFWDGGREWIARDVVVTWQNTTGTWKREA